MNPGISNRQVLEIYNASNVTLFCLTFLICKQHPLALVPGTKICQFIFLKMEGEAEYTGRFQGDKNEL